MARSLRAVYKLKASAVDCAEFMQPSKFECVNESPHAMSKGEADSTAHPGAPCTSRMTWLYLHLIHRLSTGTGSPGMSCLTWKIMRSFITSWSVSQCCELNDRVACISRVGPISVGSERDKRKLYSR